MLCYYITIWARILKAKMLWKEYTWYVRDTLDNLVLLEGISKEEWWEVRLER